MEALSQVINTMKELQPQKTKHHSESILSSGNKLERIYHLLGDNRVTRSLSKLHEETHDDHKPSMKLIKFIEKDLKVQQ